MSYIISIIMLLIVLLFSFSKGLANFHKKKRIKKSRESLKRVEHDKIIDLNRERRKYEVKYQRWFTFSGILVIIIIVVVAIMLKCDVYIDFDSYDGKKVTQEMINERSLAVGGIYGYYEPGQIYKVTENESEEEKLIVQFSDVLLYDFYNGDSGDIALQKAAYVKKVSDIIENPDKRLTKPEADINFAEGKEREIYDNNLEQLKEMETAKIPESCGEQETGVGAADYLDIGLEGDMKEYKLRNQCYIINPTLSMLKQAAKAALNTEIALAKDGDYRIVELLTYTGYAVSHYLCLLRYGIDEYESKTDCCFWIGKALFIASEGLPAEFEDLIHHLRLLAYAFCEKGLEYMEELDEQNQHENDLEELYDLINTRIA